MSEKSQDPLGGTMIGKWILIFGVVLIVVGAAVWLAAPIQRNWMALVVFWAISEAKAGGHQETASLRLPDAGPVWDDGVAPSQHPMQ